MSALLVNFSSKLSRQVKLDMSDASGQGSE